MTRSATASGSLPDEDRRFLEQAMDLAGRGWGRVHPNPLVGCVVVKDGHVVGRGWHAEWGGDHAEVVALADAGDQARGSTLYVTLEPCNHHDKTPPCSAAVVAAGVSRVVFGAADPGEVSGGGARTLAAAGVEVIGPVFTDLDARAGNPFFFHDRTDRPWVALKLALSLDGRIAVSAGRRTAISGPDSNAEVQRLRAGFDALMVGANTAMADDPRLTVRGSVTPRVPPRRVVLDRSGRVPGDARVVAEGDAPTLVVTSDRSAAAWRKELARQGARVLVLGDDAAGGTGVGAVLRVLREEGVRSVLCEGGGRLAGSLLEGGVVDRLYLILAPILIGPEGVPAFPGAVGTGVSPFRWRHVEPPRRRGDDVWLVCEPEEV